MELKSENTIEAANQGGAMVYESEVAQLAARGLIKVVKGVEAEVDEATQKVSVQRRRIFGTHDEGANLGLVKQVVDILPKIEGNIDSLNARWAMAAVHGIAAKDELEGLLAAQMVGVHSLVMECIKRATNSQTIEEMDGNINRVTKLSRMFTTQIEALNRHRGKLSQQMVVGSVNVNEGVQAIVGSVSHDGRGKAPTEDDTDNAN